MPDAGRGAALRETLIDAATDLLDEGGPGSVTMREVGHRSDVSRAAPYLHFPDKEGLLAAVAAREVRRVVDGIEALRDSGRSAADLLRLAMVRYARWSTEQPERFRLVFGRWREESDELLLEASRANRLLVDLVVHCQDEGTLPPGDPWVQAVEIRAFTHGVAVLHQAGHLLDRDRQPVDAVDLVDAHLRRLLGPALPRSGEA